MTAKIKVPNEMQLRYPHYEERLGKRTGQVGAIGRAFAAKVAMLPRCRCGLLMPCGDCLPDTAPGFVDQRMYAETSWPVRNYYSGPNGKPAGRPKGWRKAENGKGPFQMTRSDAPTASIVRSLRSAGVDVLYLDASTDKGRPDLVAAFQGRTAWLEVKDPNGTADCGCTATLARACSRPGRGFEPGCDCKGHAGVGNSMRRTRHAQLAWKEAHPHCVVTVVRRLEDALGALGLLCACGKAGPGATHGGKACMATYGQLSSGGDNSSVDASASTGRIADVMLDASGSSILLAIDEAAKRIAAAPYPKPDGADFPLRCDYSASGQGAGGLAYAACSMPRAVGRFCQAHAGTVAP